MDCAVALSQDTELGRHELARDGLTLFALLYESGINQCRTWMASTTVLQYELATTGLSMERVLALLSRHSTLWQLQLAMDCTARYHLLSSPTAVCHTPLHD